MFRYLRGKYQKKFYAYSLNSELKSSMYCLYVLYVRVYDVIKIWDTLLRSELCLMADT